MLTDGQDTSMSELSRCRGHPPDKNAYIVSISILVKLVRKVVGQRSVGVLAVTS